MLTNDQKEFLRTKIIPCKPFSSNETDIINHLLNEDILKINENNLYLLTTKGKDIWLELILSDPSNDPKRLWIKKSWTNWLAEKITTIFNENEDPFIAFFQATERLRNVSRRYYETL